MVALAGPGTRVLLIGTGSHLAGSTLPDVPAVPATVEALGDCLVTVAGLAPEQVRLLLDPADPRAMLEAVTDAAREATDVLLLHYVGHGLVSEDGELYLATRASAGASSGLEFQALAYASIRAELRRHPVPVVVAVLDCCYSGRAGPPVSDGVVLVSADRDQAALAPAGEEHTAFTGALIRILCEGVATAPPRLTLRVVFRELGRAMGERNRPRPHLTSSDAAAELVVAPNRGYLAPDAASATVPEEDVRADPECPYRGLEPFTEVDEERFRGRDDLVEHVLSRLAGCARDGGIAVVTGPSGSGKSSLLAAGVLRALRRNGLDGVPRARSVRLTPGRDPLSALVDALDELRADVSADVRQVIVVDQFEELFAPGIDESVQREFVVSLAAAARPEQDSPRAVVVLGLRADFHGPCARHPELVAALERHQVIVGPMTTAQLRTAIVEPAEQAGLGLRPGLVELLLRDTGANPDDDRSAEHDPGALPLLSHALLSTWQRRTGRVLTLEGYQATGGVPGALRQTARQTYDSLTPPVRAAARSALLSMVDAGPDTPGTRRRVPLAELRTAGGGPGTTDAALAAFADARLITLDGGTAVLTHEALIRAWPELRGWLEQDREFLSWRARLDERRREWDTAGRDHGLLPRGAELAAAGDWLRDRPGDLSEPARDYIRRGQELRGREQRRGRAVVAALSALVLVAGVLATVAVNRGNRLSHQLELATAPTLAAASGARELDDPVFAARLALRAWRADPTNPDVRSALAREYQDLRSVDGLLPSLGDVPLSSVSLDTGPTGPVLFAVRSDNTLAIVDSPLGSAPTVRALPGVGPDASPTLISPNGQWVAGQARDGSLLVWDVPARTGPVRLTSPPATGHRTSIVGFDSDGSNRIAVLDRGADHSQRLTEWDIVRHTMLAQTDLGPDDTNGSVTSARLTADPDRVLIRSQRGNEPSQLTVRALSSGAALLSYPADASVALHGKAILTCRPDNTWGADVSLVDAATGAPIRQLALGPTPDACYALRLSSDEHHLLISNAVNEQGQVARLMSLDTGEVDELQLPPLRENPDTDPNDNPRAIQSTDTTTAEDLPGGGMSVLLARGASVLRLQHLVHDVLGPPPPESGRLVYQDTTKRYLVVVAGRQTPQVTATAVDAATGRRVGSLDFSALPVPDMDDYIGLQQFFDISDAFVLAERSGGVWRLFRYRLPTFAPEPVIVLPSRGGTGPARFASFYQGVNEDRIWGLTAGLVSVSDARTGVSTGPPLDIDNPPLRPGLVDLSLRPGHPDQFVVASSDRIELWSVSGRRPLAVLAVSLGTQRIIPDTAFTLDGSRLAVLTAEHTIVMWDPSTGTTGTPLPAPDPAQVLGFTADGMLVTVADISGSGEKLELWDVNAGQLTATLTVPFSVLSQGQLDPSGREYVGNGGDEMPTVLAVSAQAWADQLCGSVGGSFTQAQQHVLPAGVDPVDSCG
jgi:WD40 repeat protein